MPAITLKNIPINLYRSLKESAKIHHRSINGEAIACIEKSVGATEFSPESTLNRISKLQSGIKLPKLTEKMLQNAKEAGRA